MKMHKPKLYPADWPTFSRWIRFTRAQQQCECLGQCGTHKGHRCQERHLQAARFARGRVILTAAHMCHCYPKCKEPGHVIAACQACHLRIDTADHLKARRKNAIARAPHQPEARQLSFP